MVESLQIGPQGKVTSSWSLHHDEWINAICRTESGLVGVEVSKSPNCYIKNELGPARFFFPVLSYDLSPFYSFF